MIDQGRGQRVLSIGDSADRYAALIRENVAWALFYARMDHHHIDVSEDATLPDLSRFSAIVLCMEALHRLDQTWLDGIRRFVTLGGGLAVVYRGWNAALSDLFGISSQSGPPDFVADEVEGLFFPSDLLPGFHNLRLTPAEISGHTSYDLKPHQDATVLATSSGGRPLAWLTRFGEGRVIFWNTVILGEKRARGLIVQSIAAVQRMSVLTVANVATLQIDDFPPEMFEQTLEPIASEYGGMDNLTFYDRIWYADMVSLAQEHGLRYTWLTVFDYDDTVPPHALEFEPDGKRKPAASKMPFNSAAAQSAAHAGEMGLHGYNHFPLLLDLWRTSDQMIRALNSAAVEWRASGLGPLPTTYVPPNNEYDEVGAIALSRTFPEMRAICGLFGSGDVQRGGNREFGPEPWNPDLFCLPRATSGYELSDITRFVLASQIGTMGVWTHFLHTDDVYETPDNFPNRQGLRNARSLPWRVDENGEKTGLFHRFEAGMEFVCSTFPWLNFVETRDALPILKAHLKNEVHVGFGSKTIVIRSTYPSWFQLRINDGRQLNPVGLSNAEIMDVQRGRTFTQYTLRSTKPDVRLEMI